MPAPESSIPRDLPDEIVGEHIRLRPYRLGDGAALYDAVNEDRPRLRRWLPWVDEHQTPAASEEAACRLHERWRLREELIVGVWEQDGRRLLGGSGLHRINWDVPSFEIGYWLRPSAEGHGCMTEAVSLLCRLAFDTLGASRVFIRCDSANLRSAAVPRRLGFVHEATLRNETRDADGALRDMLVFALTPDDYYR